MHVQVYVVVPAQKIVVMPVCVHVDEQDIRRTKLLMQCKYMYCQAEGFFEKRKCESQKLELIPTRGTGRE